VGGSAFDTREFVFYGFPPLLDLRGVWSQHLAEDYTAEHPGVSVPLNKTASIGYNQRFVTAFPDIHFEVLHVLTEGDYVLIQWRASGTHTERLATLTGETIPRPGEV
jgi:hypothetical protein